MSSQTVLSHLHRAQGQLAATERMMRECRSCNDVVMQLMAARSSIEKLVLRILSEETDVCLRSNKREDRERIKDVATTLFKYT